VSCDDDHLPVPVNHILLEAVDHLIESPPITRASIRASTWRYPFGSDRVTHEDDRGPGKVGCLSAYSDPLPFAAGKARVLGFVSSLSALAITHQLTRGRSKAESGNAASRRDTAKVHKRNKMRVPKKGQRSRFVTSRT
jgi:hypothetical protein